MVGNSIPFVKTFNCKSCGGQVSIRASGFSINVVCQSCHSIIDTTDENYKVIAKTHSINQQVMSIPLGTRGKLFGTLWEVVGFLIKEDSEKYEWKEYLLFNPKQGYRWLSEFHGHWNFIKMTKKKPIISDENATFENKKYEFFSKYKGITKFIAGEFYWQIRLNDTVQIKEYISPPEILTMEKDDDEIVWSIGVKIGIDLINEAFQLKLLTSEDGVSPNQVNPYKENASSMTRWCYAFFFILLFIQLFSVKQAKNQVVYEDKFKISKDPLEKLTRTPSFKIPGNLSNLEVGLFSNISNNWIEVDGELVNENKKDETYDFVSSAEYYFGTDSDGSWSEGSSDSELTLSSVPAGDYHINFSAVNTDKNLSIMPLTTNEIGAFRLVLTKDVPRWSNFFWSIGILIILPLFYLIRSRRFEAQRWAQSSKYF